MAEDIVGGALSHAGQGGQGAIVDGLFDALDGADAQFLGDQHGRLGADTGDGHEGQDAVGQLPYQLVVGPDPAGVQVFLGFFADGLADARNFLQVHLIPHRLFQGEGEVVDGAGGALVSPDFEDSVALHFQEGGHVLKEFRYFFVAYRHFSASWPAGRA